MGKFCTYCHYTPSGTLFYVGKGSEFRSKTTKNRNKKWHEVVEREGGFVSKIMAYWENELDALNHEKALIEKYRGEGINLVNITSGGQGVSGLIHSEKTKEILREKSLKNGSVERCLWLCHDPEIKQKRIKATTGKKRALESKAKMAAAKAWKARPVTINGIQYASISDLAKKLGVYKTTIRRWINAGQMNKVVEVHNAKIS